MVLGGTATHWCLIRNHFQCHEAVRQIGLWEMKGAKPTGWGLNTLWILEALIVLWMCYTAGSSMETPFCEDCNCWTEKKGSVSLAATEIGTLAEALEEEEYDVISKLATAEISPSDHLVAQCWAAPICQESGYLNVSTVKILQGKEGPETKTDVVIPQIAVPHSVIEEVDELVVNKIVKTAETAVKPDIPSSVSSVSLVLIGSSHYDQFSLTFVHWPVPVDENTRQAVDRPRHSGRDRVRRLETAADLSCQAGRGHWRTAKVETAEWFRSSIRRGP